MFGNRDLRGIKGVTFYDRKEKELVVNPDREFVGLDELPLPAIHLLPKYDSMSIVESVGCFDSCSFCSIHTFHNRPGRVGYRLKSPSRIKLEVEQATKLGAKNINLIGELTLYQRQRAFEIADGIDTYHLPWTADSHPRFVLMQKEILPELKKKGLRRLQMGIESGSQHCLDIYNKQTTTNTNEAALEAALSAGIKAHISLIIFNPYATMNDLQQNIDFLYRHLGLLSEEDDYPKQIYHRWIPNPGTALYEQAERDGLVISGVWGDDTFRFRDLKVAKAYALLKYFNHEYRKAYKEAIDDAKKQLEDLAEKNENTPVGMLEVGAAYLNLWRISRIPIDVLSIAHETASEGGNGKNNINVFCQKALSLPKPKTLLPIETPLQDDETSEILRSQLDNFVKEFTGNISLSLKDDVQIVFLQKPDENLPSS